MSAQNKTVAWVNGSDSSNSLSWTSLKGLWNDWVGNTQIDKQLAAQKSENQFTREYNLDLAKMQNQWNLQQWNRENAYNSPVAQKSRLQAAGLNADMMYGSGGVMNTAASSPQMTSGAAASPMDWSSLGNKKTIGDSIDATLDRQYKQAMIDNMNADTKNKGYESSILASDAAFRDAWNNGLLATQNVDIRVKEKGIELSAQQIKESQAKVRSLDASCTEIYASVDAIRNGIKNDNERLNLEKMFNKAQIDLARAQTNLTEEQAFRLASELERVLRSYDDKHDIDRLTVVSLENTDERHRHEVSRLIIDNERAYFDAKINGPYEGYDSTLSFADNALKFFTTLLKPIGYQLKK